MQFLVMSLLLVLFLAWITDLILTEEQVVKWRQATRALRARFGELDVRAATEAANRWFLGLFEAIYGARFFSRRRLAASLISTLLAMVLVAYIFEIFGLPGFHSLYHGLIATTVIATPVNFIADYLSLQETFWIMKKSQKRRFLGIFLLSIADFVLTTLIYLLTVVGIVFVILHLQDMLALLDEVLDDPDFGEVDEELGLGSYFGILAASTYVTSLLWAGFVGSAIGLRLLQMLSPALRRIVRIVSTAQRPALTVAGFVCATSTLAYGAWRAAAWLIETAIW